MNITYSKTDILILGSGGAGLFAALHASQANSEIDITIAVKGLVGKCGCTRMVQGGYNVALAEGDSVRRHFIDTIVGGKWLPDQKLAWQLCETAIERVQELENEIGCFFDRNPDGSLHQKAFAGQSFDRTVHKSDLTGIEIINRLMEKVRALKPHFLEEHRAIGLIPAADQSGIAGAMLIDMRQGHYHYVEAKSVMLATGAGPTMYRYHTPSGDKSCDGLAMALEAGLSLRDMEMVQFHPTGLLGGENTRMTGTVLEEGLRGAGGYLLNGEGRRFMVDYNEAGERATRDIVSRAIDCEMREGRVGDLGGVYLSMAHLGADYVAKTFPGMVKRCRDCGFDLAGDKVEVVPTAHYMMGGVLFNPDTSTAIDGLFAAGEDCGGVHGANRLGGNGVANSTVFGGIAGDTMADFVANRKNWRDPDHTAISRVIARAEHPFSRPQGDVFALRQDLAETMWDEAGITRDAQGLVKAIEKLDDYAEALLDIGLGSQNKAFNISWHEWMNLNSLITVSKVIALAASGREDSRGAHFRKDFPETGDLSGSAFTCVKQHGDALELSLNPVSFSIMTPDERGPG